ncbi:ferric reductase-like transmembrane domain-containing protein [Streptococcus sp. NLN64]|uniref:ferredoxin reductase family protein n=1 Tax=Streptococcus sp. NLN64 TaxID=2822799 RepID=UPI0018C9827C|nr:ferric reductase-like transmembrane domain-containing protein [Streptococcus sp. NLN64]MBG9367983.1 ferric reductase-like transmembrane domain-containing protein [Streptococcus sp. NLN64]
MKSLKGIFLLLFSFAITAWVWAQAGLTMFIIPALALTALSLTFLLTTRALWLEKLFHGLENMYALHKFLACFALVLMLLHRIGMVGLVPPRLGEVVGVRMGNYSLAIFLILILLAYLGKKIPYETWRWIHRLVFFGYLFAVHHVYMLMGNLVLTFTPLGIVTNYFILVGFASAFYIMIYYPTFGFSYFGKVAKIEKINHDTIELTLQLQKNFPFEAGQFAFLQIREEGFETRAHPFSISGGHGKTIQFTIKNSGDHTANLYNNLKVGHKVALDRAYGHMLLQQGQKRQVWIAGGIGLTPFLAGLRQAQKLEAEIDLYYAYTGEENAIHLDLLQEEAKTNPHFRLHLVNSQVDGYLDFEQESLPESGTVFMCGPQPMMAALSKQIHKINPKLELIYEGFKFR